MIWGEPGLPAFERGFPYGPPPAVRGVPSPCRAPPFSTRLRATAAASLPELPASLLIRAPDHPHDLRAGRWRRQPGGGGPAFRVPPAEPAGSGVRVWLPDPPAGA
jgi:hypothetical protein